jgi:hypothetical protein
MKKKEKNMKSGNKVGFHVKRNIVSLIHFFLSRLCFFRLASKTCNPLEIVHNQRPLCSCTPPPSCPKQLPESFLLHFLVDWSSGPLYSSVFSTEVFSCTTVLSSDKVLFLLKVKLCLQHIYQIYVLHKPVHLFVEKI